MPAMVKLSPPIKRASPTSSSSLIRSSGATTTRSLVEELIEGTGGHGLELAVEGITLPHRLELAQNRRAGRAIAVHPGRRRHDARQLAHLDPPRARQSVDGGEDLIRDGPPAPDREIRGEQLPRLRPDGLVEGARQPGHRHHRGDPDGEARGEEDDSSGRSPELARGEGQPPHLSSSPGARCDRHGGGSAGRRAPPPPGRG